MGFPLLSVYFFFMGDSPLREDLGWWKKWKGRSSQQPWRASSNQQFLVNTLQNFPLHWSSLCFPGAARSSLPSRPERPFVSKQCLFSLAIYDIYVRPKKVWWFTARKLGSRSYGILTEILEHVMPAYPHTNTDLPAGAQECVEDAAERPVSEPMPWFWEPSHERRWFQILSFPQLGLEIIHFFLWKMALENGWKLKVAVGANSTTNVLWVNMCKARDNPPITGVSSGVERKSRCLGLEMLSISQSIISEKLCTIKEVILQHLLPSHLFLHRDWLGDIDRQ